jgi:hypothetical protein
MHLRYDRYGEKEDCQVGGNIDGSGGEIQRHNIGTLCTEWDGRKEGGTNRATLENEDESQDEASQVGDEQRYVVGPSEEVLALCQGQIEHEDRAFDGHQRRVLSRKSNINFSSLVLGSLMGCTHIAQ